MLKQFKVSRMIICSGERCRNSMVSSVQLDGWLLWTRLWRPLLNFFRIFCFPPPFWDILLL